MGLCEPCSSLTVVSANAPNPCVGEPCPDVLDDKCVIYTGPDFSCLGIKTNQRLDDVLQLLADKVCQIAESCCTEACLVPVVLSSSSTCDGITAVFGAATGTQVYEVQYKLHTDVSYTGAVTLALGIDTKTFDTLLPDTAYDMQVRMVCGLSNSDWITIPITTLPPVNCVVSAWGPWGACVAGVKTRTRTVLTQPACGGTACPVLEQTQSC